MMATTTTMMATMSMTARALEETDKYGQTPLHLASLRDNAEAVRFLLDEAAALDLSDTGHEYEHAHANNATSRIGSRSGSTNLKHCLPAKMLAAKDKEGKTLCDLAIKKKRPGLSEASTALTDSGSTTSLSRTRI